jgi:hypothetical protein
MLNSSLVLKTITPELIEQMCLRILELEAKFQTLNE